MNRVVLFSLVMIIGCKSAENYYRYDQKNWQESVLPDSLKIAHTFYLIGDAGLPTTDSVQPTLAMVQQMLETSDQKNTSVIFQGDNIYPSGLHKKKSKYRENDELAINAQMDILKNFQGRVVFLPGNHDWKEGKKQGDKYVKRQEKYVEKYLDRGNTFLPDGGCPGPVEIEINDRLLWVIIDTQWWLHSYDKPAGDQDDCDVSNREEYLLQIEDVLKKNRNKQVIISGHHPLYSNGNHGGYFLLSDHIFPLTNIKPNL